MNQLSDRCRRFQFTLRRSLTSRTRPLHLALAAAILLSLLATTPTQADLVAVKVSGEMPDFGDVYWFNLSPDGRYLVYLADQETDEVIELYSMRLPRGEPVKLNKTLPELGHVVDFLITPDSQFIVYQAAQDTPGVMELYRLEVGGGEPSKLNADISAGGAVVDFKISPDGQSVVYRAYLDSSGKTELFRNSLAGGPEQKLSRTLADDEDVWSFKITPNSQGVVYLIHESGAGDRLYSAPITGGGSYTLTPAPSHDVHFPSQDYKITPNSLGVVFRASLDTPGVTELYSVRIDGTGGPRKLNVLLPPDAAVHEFQIASSSQRVVYLAEQNIANQYELYSVLTVGGGLIALNPALIPARYGVESFQITPNGQGVVYTSDQDSTQVFELYSVLITGGTTYKLNDPLPGGLDVEAFQITSNNQGVVFSFGYKADLPGLSSAWIDGQGPAIELKASADGSLEEYKIFPTDQFVVYVSDRETAGMPELYIASILGGSSVKLNAPLVAGGGVGPPAEVGYLGEFHSFLITPDGKGVVYMADQDVDEKVELYLVYDEPQARLYLPVITKHE